MFIFVNYADTLTVDIPVLLEAFEPDQDREDDHYTEKEIEKLEFAGIHAELAIYEIKDLLKVLNKGMLFIHGHMNLGK